MVPKPPQQVETSNRRGQRGLQPAGLFRGPPLSPGQHGCRQPSRRCGRGCCSGLGQTGDDRCNDLEHQHNHVLGSHLSRRPHPHSPVLVLSCSSCGSRCGRRSRRKCTSDHPGVPPHLILDRICLVSFFSNDLAIHPNPMHPPPSLSRLVETQNVNHTSFDSNALDP